MISTRYAFTPPAISTNRLAFQASVQQQPLSTPQFSGTQPGKRTSFASLIAPLMLGLGTLVTVPGCGPSEAVQNYRNEIKAVQSDPQQVFELVKKNISSPDAGVRKDALKDLGKVNVNPNEKLAILKKTIKDPDYNVRSGTLDTVAADPNFSNADKIALIQEGLKDSEGGIRSAALSTLTQLPNVSNAEKLPALKQAFQSEDASTRASVLNAITNMRDINPKEEIPLILTGLIDESTQVQNVALEGAKYYAENESVDATIRLKMTSVLSQRPRMENYETTEKQDVTDKEGNVVRNPENGKKKVRTVTVTKQRPAGNADLYNAARKDLFDFCKK